MRQVPFLGHVDWMTSNLLAHYWLGNMGMPCCCVDYRPTDGSHHAEHGVSSVGAFVLGASVQPAEAHIRRTPACACALRNDRRTFPPAR